MGAEKSRLRAENARIDERNKYMQKAAVKKEEDFKDYLRSLQAERERQRAEDIEEAQRREALYQETLARERAAYEEEKQRREERYREQKREEERRFQLAQEALQRERDAVEAERRQKQFEEEKRKEEERRQKLLQEEEAREREAAKKRAAEKLLENMRAEIAVRRDRVQNKLKPGCTLRFSKLKFPEVLNIGFFGTTGVGKTSLMNSLAYAINGSLDDTDFEQAATEDFHGGHTVRRLHVQLTEHIAFIDNRGVGIEDLVDGDTVSEDAARELIRQLEGRGSYAKAVQWRSRGAEPASYEEQNDEDRIYCTILVFDARKAENYFKVVKAFVDVLHEWQGRFPIAVITNVDRSSPDQLEEIHLVLRSAGITDLYEVANVTSEKKKLEEKYQVSLLKMIERCMKDGDRIFELRSKVEKMK